jgi:hypothetical protein
VVVSRQLEAEGKGPAAARVLAPVLAGKDVPAQLYRRTWNLAARSDDPALKSEIADRAFAALPNEAWPAEAMIRVLSETEQYAKAAALALALPNGLMTDPAAALMAYDAARREQSRKAHVLRDRFLAMIGDIPDATVWRKRLESLERKPQSVSSRQSDAAPKRFLIVMQWGRVGSNLLLDILAQSGNASIANERLNTIAERDQQLAWYNDHYQIDVPRPSHSLIGAKENILALVEERLCGALATRWREDHPHASRRPFEGGCVATTGRVVRRAHATRTRPRSLGCTARR